MMYLRDVLNFSETKMYLQDVLNFSETKMYLRDVSNFSETKCMEDMGFAFSQAAKWNKCLEITTEHLSNSVNYSKVKFIPLPADFQNLNQIPKIGKF